MECNNYRLETEFLNDGSSVAHTTRVDANLPPTTTVWTTTRLIGHGGDGVVDLQSEASGLVRAVKRVHVCDRYMKEVIILSKVSDRHDLFVQFLGWYEDKNFLYIAMEFIANGDLAEYIKARGESPVPEQTCQAISRQLLEGLQVLHERLICHRDLKPRNILVATLEPISVKITDFGVSKHLEGTVYRTRVGTVGYIAPEIQGMWPPPRTRRVPFGMAVDIWAAGCIIHQLLSLQLPFAREWEDGQDITLTDGYSVGDCSQMVVEMDMPRLLAYCMGQEPLPIEALERSGTSLNAMEVVRALLRADPAARVTATEALEYSWLLRPEQHFRFRVEPTITGPSTSGSRRTPPPHQPADPGAPPEEPNPLTDYPHTAKALYPFDSGRYSSKQNILSFSMFDIMDVLDVSKTSAWWSARDKSGERGWVPSNYFVVINSPPAEDPSINTHSAPVPAPDLRETVIERSTTSNLSVLSLIITILQGYKKFKTFVPDNKMHEQDAELLSSTVMICRVLLRTALDNFLQDIVGGHLRRTMLDDLDNPHWHDNELNTRVNNTLGRSIDAVRGAALGCTQAFGQIQHLQASLNQWPTHEGNPEKVAENVLSDLVELRERRKELTRYSSCVFQLLNSVKVKAGFPELRGARLILAVMERLQVAISDALICQCHTVYLYLDGHVVTETSNSNRNGVSSEIPTPMDVKPQISLLFTKGKNTTMIPESFLVSCRPVIVPSQTPDHWRGNICANVESQRVGYKRYFRIPHSVNGGFMLRLEKSLPYALDDGGGMFSLKHLITTRPHQLTTIDRLLIGIGLAESFLHLYGSPWLRRWGVDTIYYLTEQAKEEPTARRWTPHLVLSPGAGATDAVSDRNQGMFRLGYMLLQVGLGGWGLGSGTVVLTSGVPTLVRLDESMGSAYANLARWCLMQGHRSISDLMPNLAIEMFMIHLDRLRRAADTADT